MNCYNCGVILNRKNRSVEHIINASIGGFKKGYNLLCQECNKAFGRTIDYQLGKQLGVFGMLLNIPLDRGEHITVPFADVKWGNINCHRGIAKICLNYYLAKGFSGQYCEQVKAFVRGEKMAPIFHYYLPAVDIHEAQEVSHIIHLSGSAATGVLYAYIELFNMQNQIVLFNMAYTGPDIHVTYCRDVVRNIELVKSVDLGLSRQQLEELPVASEGSAVRLERLMGIIRGIN